MDEIKLNKLYSNLLIDPDFERLEIMRNQPNIFDILGVKNYEIRHSNFLSWLLDPFGSHGIGDYFLKRFLLEIFQDSRSHKNIVDIYDLLSENLTIHREKLNIDLLLEFDSTLIVIENKIHSSEGKTQLSRYKEVVEKDYIKKPIFVYLTKNGFEASLKDYIELSYSTIYTFLDDLVKYKGEAISSDVMVYIKDYMDNLNNNILKKDPANELAEKIYKRHKELFDFIYDNMPDKVAEFYKYIEDFFIQKGYVIGSPNKGMIRFTSPDISKMLKPYDKNYGGWRNKEPFLFEIDFFWVKNKIVFKAIVAPSDAKLKNTLTDIIEKVEDAKAPIGKIWSSYFITSQSRNPLEVILEDDHSKINQLLNDFYDKIQPIISKVENVLRENKERIKNDIDY